MPLMGKLEDVTIVDVVHLLSASGKTGVLSIESAQGRATIVLRKGDVCAATHPSPDVHVGRILMETGLVDASEIDAALRACATRRIPIVAALVEAGRITTKQGWSALKQLVERTLEAVRDWRFGTFAFEPSTAAEIDGFRYTPATFEGGDVTLHTRELLGQAVEVLDERNRQDAASTEAQGSPASRERTRTEPGQQPDVREASEADAEDTVERGGESHSPTPLGEDAIAPPDANVVCLEAGPATQALDGSAIAFGANREVIVCTPDGVFRNLVSAACRQAGVWVYTADGEDRVLEIIESSLRKGAVHPLLLDITGPHPGAVSRRGVLLAKHVKSKYPLVPLIILGPASREASILAFRNDARAYLPKARWQAQQATLEEIKKTLRLILECLAACSRERDTIREQAAIGHREMSTLRQRVLEITKPGSPADVSMMLLKHVAEYLRRCVMFVVCPHDLLGLGGFGLGQAGETTSDAIMGLRIPLHKPSLPRRVLEQCAMHQGPVDDVLLWEHLFSRIGPPASREGVLLPLSGRERPIALIYADHGKGKATAIKTETLEILACLASLSLEIALYRRTRVGPSKSAPERESCAPELVPEIEPSQTERSGPADL